MHSTCAYAKTCKSYHSKCKYMHGLFCYLCHLDMTLRITLIETTTLGTTFLTESLMWDFFFKKFGNKKRNCFTVYICVVLTTWYNSIYCVPFTGFALFVSVFYVYIFSFPPPPTPDFKFLQRRGWWFIWDDSLTPGLDLWHPNWGLFEKDL